MQSVRIPGEHTKLFIRDLSSKFGVFVNRKRIESANDVEVIIEEDQMWVNHDKKHVAGRGYGGFVTVVIGDKTSFRLERVDWSLCSQGLTAITKVNIISTAAEIDCKVEETWTPGISTHLVIGKSKRSEKLSLALAEGGYLVNVEWLKAVETSFVESWKSKGQKDARTLEVEFPAPIPDAFELSNIQWAPNPSRRTLFKDFRFISVANVKYKGLSQVIQCAGGTWTKVDPKDALKLINECLVATVIPIFLHPYGEEDVAKAYPKLDTVLKKMGYRWAHEDEIGMAILYASTDIYCNPKYLDPLPTLEKMASLQSSQFEFSQYSGKLGESLSISAPSTLSRAGSNAGTSKGDPPLIGGEIELIDASFDLSQLMLPPRKSAKPVSVKPVSAKPINIDDTRTPEPISSFKPAKKKAKIDRLAMFLDELDDDIVNLDPSELKDSIAASQDIVPSSLPVPTPLHAIDTDQSHDSTHVASPKKPNVATEKNIVSREQSPVIIENERRSDSSPSTRKELKGTQLSKGNGQKEFTENASQQVSKAVTNSLDKTDFSSPKQSSEHSASLSKAGTRKKPTVIDRVQEDILALKLEVKVGRQKESLDEAERSRRLESNRLQEKSKDASQKLMQSEWSERLVINGKRRKLAGIQSASQQSSNAGSEASIEIGSSDVQILSEVDQKDWPERWKNLPNFKIQDSSDSILHDKWKNVPNFKAFRKSTKAGLHVKPRHQVILTLDGELKQEKASRENGKQVKQEPQDSPIPSPLARRKVGQAQMAREDLELLLADD
ncbi:hypothetical protein BGZ46_009023 [Entomortierella lignicola]|nr:hypothetical protein BGZ46_009023 [Entomortierella lignicola]